MSSDQSSEQSTASHTFSEGLSFEGFRQIMAQFAKERNWEQFHTPRNLLLALTGEVGELAELFQWRGEVQKGLPEFSAHEKTRVGEEMADCLAYLFRLADQSGIDLTAAVLRKMDMNRQKYPIEKCLGKSDKYTTYQQTEQNPSNEATTEPKQESQ